MVAGNGRQRARWRRFLRSGLLAVALGAAVLFAACSSLRYVTQAAIGGASILCKRRPIEKVLRRGELDDESRLKLEAALEIREFAVRELDLPDNKSYRSYVELGRDVVTWNVVAAPELSVEPVTWCFPVAGCVSYRGYFDERHARAFADRLRRRGFDVAMTGAIAYSTLGWFADPLLDTFLRYPEWQLAGLVFHELSHQVAYLPGDTAFNESFASAVEELGTERWLASRARSEEAAAAALAEDEDRRFLDELLATRACLATVFASESGEEEKREEKSYLLDDLRARLAGLRANDELSARYDAWLQRPLNNADLAAVADYEALVPAFRRLFEQSSGFADFYDAVRELSELDSEERAARLAALDPVAPAPAPRDCALSEARASRALPGTVAPGPGSR